ncbi:MAG: exopolysaccharide biosynthesis polyprenyl glycosylphosphotransferase [Alphaproteobacteria bacterium]|nr:exopolysaccharide biosynthesis polyprenyl glycosylphosphotransferase [Alphaproteobacteria bacterium]
MVAISQTQAVGRSGTRAFRKRIEENQIHFMVFALDVLALLMAYQVAVPLAAFLVEHFGTSSPAEFGRAEEVRRIVYLCVSVGALLFFFASGHYTRRIPWWSQVQTLVKVAAVALLVDGFASFALELDYSRILIATNWVAMLVFVLLSRYGVNLVKARSEAWRIPAVIVGDMNTATDTLFALVSDAGMGLEARCILMRDREPEKFDRDEFPSLYRDIPVHSGLADFESFILGNPDDYYIVSIESFRGRQRDALIALLNRNRIRFGLVPAISRLSMVETAPLRFFGNDVMLLDSRNFVTTPVGRVLKRGMDVVGATAALAIFLAPMLVVAAMLKVEGQGGSVLYGGNRVGRHGRVFRCWKFRTMEPGTDHLLHEYLARSPEAKAVWERYFKLPDDPRVQTRTARFIRKASIDELPQLWNVLKGEMSLVGPRPILESEAGAYGDAIREYKSVKPGITGLWQASGRNGTSFRRRVVWDSWYVRNWSLWGDIVIIFKTVKVVLDRRGAS